MINREPKKWENSAEYGRVGMYAIHYW